jgi:hypothetical protein
MVRHLLVLATVTIGAVALAAMPPTVNVEPYVRVRQAGDAYMLDVAVRRFAPASGKGPAIWLMGVVHLAEPAYYEQMQRELEQRSLVLYEAVGAPDKLPENATDAQRKKWTKQALWTLGEMLERHHGMHDSYPVSLALLRQSTAQTSSLGSAWIRKAMTDGWGRPVHYTRTETGYELRSDGPNGQPEADDAPQRDDVILKGPMTKEKVGDPRMLYTTMASSLNLKFQMTAINYDRPTFVHSDLTMGELRDALEGDDDDDRMQAIMSMLEGSSITGKFVGVMFNIVGASPKLREIVRFMMVDMLGQLTDDMSKLKMLGDDTLMKRLITDRNRIVIGDVKQVLGRDDPPKSIGVFYGAGHMVDMEKRLRKLGYEPRETVWMTAITAEPKKAGIDDATVQSLRAMIKAQLAELQKQAPRKKKTS